MNVFRSMPSKAFGTAVSCRSTCTTVCVDPSRRISTNTFVATFCTDSRKLNEGLANSTITSSSSIVSTAVSFAPRFTPAVGLNTRRFTVLSPDATELALATTSNDLSITPAPKTSTPLVD